MTIRSDRPAGALGRGLSSLIPQRAAPTGAVVDIALARVVPNPHQPRRHWDETELEELAASIREHGVLQPILVTETLDGYQVVAGERRVRAARLAGLERIPALVRHLADRDQLEIALVENVQRADLDAIEEALAYRQLMDEFGMTQEGVAERVGRARATVANTLRLLDLHLDVQAAIAEGRISEGHGRALAGLPVDGHQSNCTTQIGSTKTTGGINSCPKINPTTDTFARHLAPGTYNVRVNTTSSSASATFGYVLKANLVASCGNGIVEGSEECDGGATCAADCTILPVCGNGLKQTGETCDDGNTVPGDGCGMTCQWESVAETDASNNTCAAPNGPFAIPTHSVGLLVTGAMNTTSDQDWFAITVPNYADLHIQTFDSTGPNSCNTIDTNLELYNSTACGTALATNDTGGVNNCSLITAAAAGARHVAPGTYVVKVNGFSATFNYMLQVKFTALCGNGIVEGSEQCDGGAGCNADCTATVACGNGILQGSEACDDGNLVDGDGCTSTCTVELGYACAGTSPNRCAPICGDNILVAPETCDGGNTLNGDTCDSSCRIEASLTEIEANDTLATADTNATNGILISSVSTVITGAVTPIADKDIFKMNLASTGVVRLEMFDSSGNDCTSANVATATRLTVVGTTPCTVATQATACAGIGPSATCNATTLTCQVNTDSGSGIGNCSALVLNMNAGTYYAIVEKAAPTTGVPFNYKLQVAVQTNRGNESETNELFSAADGITGSDVYVFGSHQNQPDFDTFAIFVPAGKSIRAETIEGSGETCESNGIDSRITLLNSAGTVLGNDSDAGRGFCSLIDGTGATAANSFAKGLTAGIYYLRVEAHTPASGSASMQFDYRLVVTIR